MPHNLLTGWVVLNPATGEIIASGLTKTEAYKLAINGNVHRHSRWINWG
jgi:hypothetical protein